MLNLVFECLMSPLEEKGKLLKEKPIKFSWDM